MRRDTAVPDVGQAPLAPFVSQLAGEWPVVPSLRHRRIESTVVSADLSGFTALSERLAIRGKEGAEELTLTINLCFTLLIDAAVGEGGDVLKFGGDALLLLFTGDDHGPRAVRASCRMQAVLASPALRAARLRMSVGAHSGAFDLFLAGEPYHDLVVAGPAATMVTRLEADARPGEVLVSAELAERLDAMWVGPRQDQRASVARARVPQPELPDRTHVIAPVRNLDDLVPRRVRDQLPAIAAAGGEHRLATIAFLELDDTDTRITEDGPEAMAAELHLLVTELEASADRYDVLFLYTDIIANGVKLIVAGGAPTSTGADEDAVLRCVQPLVTRRWPGALRAGVNRGHVFAGFLGSPSRRTYTVMGDPVNLAARLLGRAGPGQLLASDELLQHVTSSFSTTEVAPFMVKGKSALVHAHLVGDLTDETPTVFRDDYPIVGRDEQLAVLAHAIGEAERGNGLAVEIVGEAGIGKSRLVREVLNDERAVLRLLVVCQPYSEATAYAGIRPLLRGIAGINRNASADDCGAALAVWVRRVAPELEPWLPLIAIPFGATVPMTPESAEVAADFITARMHDLVSELLGTALTSTTLLVIEDLYFIDDSSLQLVRHLVRAVDDRPWVMLVTTRATGPRLLDERTQGTHIELGPLEPAAAAALTDVVAGERVLSEADVQRLTDRAAGNPLFVLELVAVVGDDELPDSIERLLAARIDQLAPSDRMLLRHAAVAGRVFDLGLLGELVRGEGDDPSAAGVDASDPARWVRMGELIEPSGPGEMRFRHALYRDVAYEGLPFRRRRALHAAIGDILERDLHEGDTVVSGLLSLHFHLGHRYDRSWRYSVIAGDSSRQAHAVVEAIEFYQRALDAARMFRRTPTEGARAVNESLGDVLAISARYDEARKAYDAARRLSGDDAPLVHARIMRKTGRLEEQRGHWPLSLRWYTLAERRLDDLVAAADDAAQGELVDLYLARAGSRVRQGKIAAAAVAVQAAIDLAETLGDDEAIANGLFILIGQGNDPDSDQLRASQALKIFENIGDLVGQGKTLNNLGYAAYYAGRWDEAVAYYERAAGLFTRAGDVADAAMTEYNMAELLVDQVRLDEADAHLHRCGRSWSAAGMQLGIALADNVGGSRWARAGSFDQARERLADAMRRLQEVGSAMFLSEAFVRAAECELLAGETASALELAAVASERVLGNEAHPGRTASLAALGRIVGLARAQRGELEGAMSELRASLALAEGAADDYQAALTMHALARVGALVGDPHADAFAAESARTLERLGVVRVPEAPL